MAYLGEFSKLRRRTVALLTLSQFKIGSHGPSATSTLLIMVASPLHHVRLQQNWFHLLQVRLKFIGIYDVKFSCILINIFCSKNDARRFFSLFITIFTLRLLIACWIRTISNLEPLKIVRAVEESNRAPSPLQQDSGIESSSSQKSAASDSHVTNDSLDNQSVEMLSTELTGIEDVVAEEVTIEHCAEQEDNEVWQTLLIGSKVPFSVSLALKRIWVKMYLNHHCNDVEWNRIKVIRVMYRLRSCRYLSFLRFQ